MAAKKWVIYLTMEALTPNKCDVKNKEERTINGKYWYEIINEHDPAETSNDKNRTLLREALYKMSDR